MIYKTTDVAKKLNISPNVITKIAKELMIQKNEHGHYIFTNKEIQQLEKYIENKKNTKQTQIDEQLSLIIKRIKENEYTISQKADNVVSFQLLNHREEIEELHESIAKLNKKIDIIDEQLIHYHSVAATTTTTPRPKKLNFWQKLFKSR